MTTGHIDMLIQSIITVLLTIISGMVALAYRDLRAEMRKSSVQIHNMQRIMFVLFAKLHPAQADVITEEMQELFLNGNGNGKFK